MVRASELPRIGLPHGGEQTIGAYLLAQPQLDLRLLAQRGGEAEIGDALQLEC
jgi:hypothetical protein